MGYLKALGVFRLISEQKEPSCRASWKSGSLVLHTTLSEEELIKFFVEEYEPSPIAVPWSGNDFFGVKLDGRIIKHKKTPTGQNVIEAFLQNKSKRIENYRQALRACIEGLETVGISKKDQMTKGKPAFLTHLRSISQEGFNSWIDAASAMPNDELKLNTLLGSGGGSDGNTHYSDNFMQNLWDVLPEFDEQKDVKDPNFLAEAALDSTRLLSDAIFNTSSGRLIKGRTSSLYNSGAIGGPNAGQGFERKSQANPWDFILTLEGTITFAGSVSRKNMHTKSHAVFPFQTRASATNSDSLGDKENAGQEIWLPLWNRKCSFRELKVLLAEGRSDWRGSQSERGVDFAKAVASIGVDRGIKSFARYGIVKGRVGGDNYNTAAYLGGFEVTSQESVHLLQDADIWVEHYRRAIDENTSKRFVSALRKIDSSIFDYCRFGSVERFQNILKALGKAERELTTGHRFRERGRPPLRPLKNLRSDWVAAADDGSMEFEIAVALAGIKDASPKLPGLRANMESVAYNKKGHLDWSDGDKFHVWKRGDLCSNLTAALERRILDAKRLNLDCLPIASTRSVSRAAIAAFIANSLEDEKIEDLLWGLICCKSIPWGTRASEVPQADEGFEHPLPRCYPILKATLSGLDESFPTPATFDLERTEVFEKLKAVKSEGRLIQLLRAERLGEACQLAARRLRNSGLRPVEINWKAETYGGDATPKRLLASLLLPVNGWQMTQLWKLISRKPQSTKR
jgi:CRISPR-associated protein Csx17